MWSVWLLARAGAESFDQAKLPRARDINMYGFSAAAAMIKPKNCSKNTREGGKRSRWQRHVTKISGGDEQADSHHANAHDNDHPKQKPGWSYYCGYRDRHDGEKKAATSPPQTEKENTRVRFYRK